MHLRIAIAFAVLALPACAQDKKQLELGRYLVENIGQCASCHTPDPTQAGRHVKTGREIEPMAVHVTPDRFTDLSKVEKRFSRDCPNVLGRECTAREKGDFILFLTTR